MAKKTEDMKKTLFGIIIFGIMATAAVSFNSCSCNRGTKEVEPDDSTKLALEMERRLREEPEFDDWCDKVIEKLEAVKKEF